MHAPGDNKFLYFASLYHSVEFSYINVNITNNRTTTTNKCHCATCSITGLVIKIPWNNFSPSNPSTTCFQRTNKSLHGRRTPVIDLKAFVGNWNNALLWGQFTNLITGLSLRDITYLAKYCATAFSSILRIIFIQTKNRFKEIKIERQESVSQITIPHILHPLADTRHRRRLNLPCNCIP